MHQKMSASLKTVIQDRTIYEDLEIFARNLYKLGKLSQRDWDNYCGLFKVMTSYLKKPDLIIYLKADTDTLISRIKKRGRDYEISQDESYWIDLNQRYETYFKNYSWSKLLVIDVNHLDIENNKEDKKLLIEKNSNTLNLTT